MTNTKKETNQQNSLVTGSNSVSTLKDMRAKYQEQQKTNAITIGTMLRINQIGNVMVQTGTAFLNKETGKINIEVDKGTTLEVNKELSKKFLNENPNFEQDMKVGFTKGRCIIKNEEGKPIGIDPEGIVGIKAKETINQIQDEATMVAIVINEMENMIHFKTEIETTGGMTQRIHINRKDLGQKKATPQLMITFGKPGFLSVSYNPYDFAEERFYELNNKPIDDKTVYECIEGIIENAKTDGEGLKKGFEEEFQKYGMDKTECEDYENYVP